jgi:hypothetical protein
LASSNTHDPNLQAASRKIAHEILEHLETSVATITKTSLTLDALSLIGNDLTQTEIDRALQSLPVLVESHEGNGDIVVRINFSEEDSTSSLDLFTFFLLLFAISKAGWNRFTGVYEAQQVDLRRLIDKAKMAQGDLKAISHWELVITNILTILFTFLIGLVVFGFFINADMTPPKIDFSEADWRNIDVISTGFIIISLLITQIIALITGNSAITYWLQIPPMNQVVKLINSIITHLRKQM